MRKIGSWLAVALLLSAEISSALTMKRLNIEELVELADVVFIGVVEETGADKAARGIPAIATTFRVEKMWKGKPTPRTTIKQLGRVGPESRTVVFAELPQFRRGERVLVFLPAPSSLGLLSPVGLGQGVFRISGSDKALNMNLRINNEMKNAGLFERLKGTHTREIAARIQKRGGTRPIGDLSLGDLHELIQVHRGVVP